MKKLLLDEERFYTGSFLLVVAAVLILLGYQTASFICAVVGILLQIVTFLQVQGKLYMLEILMRMERDNLKWCKDKVPPLRERVFIR